MGKNNKPANKGKVVPPAPEKKTVETVEPEVINDKKKEMNVIDADGLRKELMNPSQSTLDANHRVDLLNGLDRHFMQPNAASKLGISQETVDKVNAFTAHGWVAAAAFEMMYSQSEFATTLRVAQLPAFIEAAADMNIVIDQKALPAPSEEGTVQIPSTAIKPSKEAKEQIKKEHDVLVKKPEVDPTKIDSEEALKEAILFIMADRQNTIEKITDSIDFYRSYLLIQAEKSEKPEEVKKSINDKSNVALFEEISKLVHDCPLVITGIGSKMGMFTGTTKSPISAFCMLRNAAKNRKTGEYSLTDQEVADLTRIIVVWTTNLKIEKYEKNIEDHEKNLAELNKNKKANAAGIEDVKGKIESCKNSIEHLKEIISCVTNPSSEVVDTLNDKYAEKDRAAQSIFKQILEGYYLDLDSEKADITDIKHNVQQRAGIIVNLFRDATTPLTEYNEANLTEMPIKEEEDNPKK